MKYGITEENFDILYQLVILPLKNQGAEVFIFGSRATGKNHPNSDVDLIYKLKDNSILKPGVLSDIKEKIEDSKFPYSVDLFCEDNLAPSYREKVLKEKSKL